MRPRVEKTGTHGLFTDANVPIKLSDVAKQVAEHKGNVWTNIISLRREDAERLGYDHGAAWRNLIRAHAETMAKSMKIPVEDLRWYAAFHNESYHPHVHVIAYSVGKEPYLTERGIDQMRSTFARDISKLDLYHIYEEQTTYRNDLRKASREVLENIVNEINDGTYKNETVEAMLRKLMESLEGYTGKKMYGYLPTPAKNLINGIVEEMAKDKRIAELYKLWYKAIYTNNELPHRAKLVYMYLYDRKNKNGVAWPGIKRIAKDLSISVSTVRRAIKDLENAGLVRKEYAYRDNGSFTSNRYYLR